MALTNAQYDEIMRGYDKRQLQNKYIHDKRIEEAYRKAPRLREIDSEIASASVRQAYRLMDGDENALAALRLAIDDYKEERAALLSTLGYPLDYFEPIYTCPDCHDTGYINGQKCHCFKQAIINTVYSQSNIREILSRENFSTLSFDYYSDEQKNPATGLSPINATVNNRTEGLNYRLYHNKDVDEGPSAVRMTLREEPQVTTRASTLGNDIYFR